MVPALLDLGLHIAAGQPWLDKFTVPEARRVLYIDEEMSPRTLNRRVQRLCRGMASPPTGDMVRFMSRQGLLCDAETITRLLASFQAEGFSPDVVIVETLRRVLLGNENEASDIGKLWRALAPLTRRDIAIILSHHTRKPSANRGGQATTHEAAGSGDIMGNADDCLAFTKRVADDAIIIKQEKCRDAEQYPAFVVGVIEDPDDAEHTGPIRFAYEGTKAEMRARTLKGGQAQDLACCFVFDSPDQTARTADILAYLAQHGIPEKTGQTALRSCVKLGRLDKLKRAAYGYPANRQPPTPPKYDSGGGSVAADASQVLTPPQAETLADGLAAEAPGSSGNTEPSDPAQADDHMGKAA